MERSNLFGCTFSILGDSYSTFAGCIPEGYECYYPREHEVEDVLRVEDTWWHILMSKYSMILLQNNSYSGSTVCTQVRENHPHSASFVERANLSFCGECDEKPDYLFVFGGTNDSWLGRKIGVNQYADWDEDCLKEVLPAYCYVLDCLTKNYANTTIVCVVNSQIDPKIAEGILDAATHYGAILVALESVSKQNGHPTHIGMKQISQQIEVCLIY